MKITRMMRQVDGTVVCFREEDLRHVDFEPFYWERLKGDEKGVEGRSQIPLGTAGDQSWRSLKFA